MAPLHKCVNCSCASIRGEVREPRTRCAAFWLLQIKRRNLRAAMRKNDPKMSQSGISVIAVTRFLPLEFEGSHALRGEAAVVESVGSETRSVTSPAPPNSRLSVRLLSGNARSCGERRRRRRRRRRRSEPVRNSSEDAPLETRLSSSSAQALSPRQHSEASCGCDACRRSHLVAAGPRASPSAPAAAPAPAVRGSSQSHRRATVPPIGSITATPRVCPHARDQLKRTAAGRPVNSSSPFPRHRPAVKTIFLASSLLM